MKVHMQFFMILLYDLMASFLAKSRHVFCITLLQYDGVTINLDPSVTMWSRVSADPILDIKYNQILIIFVMGSELWLRAGFYIDRVKLFKAFLRVAAVG